MVSDLSDSPLSLTNHDSKSPKRHCPDPGRGRVQNPVPPVVNATATGTTASRIPAPAPGTESSATPVITALPAILVVDPTASVHVVLPIIVIRVVTAVAAVIHRADASLALRRIRCWRMMK